MKNFSGQTLFLDRSDINTDEIIPAKYLTEDSKAALAPHILEDLTIEGFDPRRGTADVNVIAKRIPIPLFGAGLVEMIALQVRAEVLLQCDSDCDGWISAAEAQAVTLVCGSNRESRSSP